MPVPGHSKAILIVEDEGSVRRVLARMLSSRGFRTIEAANGREAIQHLSRETPAAIVIDLLMPIMSGIELVKALRRNAYFRTIPTLVMTGAVDPREAATLGVPVLLKSDLDSLPKLLLQMISAGDPVPEGRAEMVSGLVVGEDLVSSG